jgi:hypothetical protein
MSTIIRKELILEPGGLRPIMTTLNNNRFTREWLSMTISHDDLEKRGIDTAVIVNADLII